MTTTHDITATAILAGIEDGDLTAKHHEFDATWQDPSSTDADMGHEMAYVEGHGWLVWDSTTGDPCPELFATEDEARLEFDARIEGSLDNAAELEATV